MAKKHTKTIRLSVQRFETDDWTELSKDLWGARGDLRRAANEIMSRLYSERRRLSKDEKTRQIELTVTNSSPVNRANVCTSRKDGRSAVE